MFYLYGRYRAAWEARFRGSDALDYDEVERELKVAQVRADMDDKPADTPHTQGLLKYEPWKVIATFVTPSAAFFSVIGGLLGYLIGRGH